MTVWSYAARFGMGVVMTKLLEQAFARVRELPAARRGQRPTRHRSIRSLETFPGLGRLTMLAVVGELVVPNYPYRIYYRVEGEKIWILHIRNTRRRPWPAL
jgi:plasmid stabilization system protein ParE